MQAPDTSIPIGRSINNNAPGGVPRKYCLKRDTPDSRDIVIEVDKGIFDLPKTFDLSHVMPPVLDQGSLGSCTANATSNALRYLLRKERQEDFLPSRLYGYYTTRVFVEHSDPNEDSGCQIRDVCIALSKYHQLPEVYWPYDVQKFNVKPPTAVNIEAAKHNIIQYRSVPQDEHTLKYILAIKKLPVIIGIQLYANIESEEVATSGVGKLPAPGEQLLGGHCVLLVGFTESTWIMLNSWSSSFGQKGFFTLPKEYLLSNELAGDFWCLTKFY